MDARVRRQKQEREIHIPASSSRNRARGAGCSCWPGLWTLLFYVRVKTQSEASPWMRRRRQGWLIVVSVYRVGGK